MLSNLCITFKTEHHVYRLNPKAATLAKDLVDFQTCPNWKTGGTFCNYQYFLTAVYLPMFIKQ